MSIPSFSKREAIKFGWQKTKEHFWQFLPILLVYFFLVMVPSGISGFLNAFSQDNQAYVKISSVLVPWLSLFGQVFSWILTIGIFRCTLKVVDGQKFAFKDLWPSPMLFLKYFLSSIIYMVVIYFGFLLLLVPGVIWAIKFQFYGLFIAEGQGPIEALKNSWQITKGVKWNLFLLNLLMGLINLAGILALLFGLLWAAPIALLAWTYVYRRLENRFKESLDINQPAVEHI